MQLRQGWAATALSGYLALGMSACGGSSGVAVAPEPAAVAPVARVSGNPFLGLDVFVPPYSNADQARRRLVQTQSPDADIMAKIADTPQARWLGGWTQNVQVVAENYVNAASKRMKLALIIAYNVPNRDCGQYSKGGAADPAAYQQWIRALADGIGNHRAIVVLEPDALPQLDMCLSPTDQEQRLELLSAAVDVLQAHPGISVYLDAGHSSWVPAAKMAERLKKAGIAKARGFALNTSNFRADDELISYGEELTSLIGDTHFIIDSSRNGNGPAPDNVWCNPAGRALGRRPTTNTGNVHLDAFVWLKAPGESDGECQGGPPAGQWFPERALEMAKNAKW